ncbi:MAG TPA: 4-hydroxy-tetrahydrodipicolinate synthase [Syntrophales bacterium]|jgi:4-hydroxy-tetrahydrodipicolinate synthase|nr:4-hydroxy-tetrahydrodipicolinate synthase [Smithella sp.]HOH72616.1 4-hydroxy-tetrahydrodipicolinate synthase [Syntrophales bacterium]HPN08565.1 4-hydroxy-tetrahydrodipicolinate synthase [Syntrophales bacterium]HPX81816.1 4-hydroxy-tetrahydrodipicolinate synthase [Syntrophales bacterium]HQB12955.1 4-hydroxy-tetrahydrodipicolinate synthase [Syntrophales bacterium]
MQTQSWAGCHVPIITPFRDDYSVDEAGLRKLVNYYIEEVKCDGLVPCGTTGESPTLDRDEHNRVIEIVVEEAAGRVPVMAGTGSNSTKEAIEMTKHAEGAGAAASLQVCPYYNRPTQDGLRRHFEAVAAATGLPLFIYNIPARTGRLIEAKTMIALSEIDNVAGMKDACGDLMITMDIIGATRGSEKKFYVLCGEDALTFPMLALGGDGGILAVSHVVGKEYIEMIRLFHAGNIDAAREIHFRTLPVVRALFIETNPVPIKEALAMMGLPAGKLRLPLVPLRPENRESLRKVLVRHGFLQG